MEFETTMPLGDDLDELLRSTYRNVVNLEEANQGVHIGMNTEARKFYRLMEDGKQPLYPGCKDFSRLRFIVELYLLKCSHGVTESFFSAMLVVLRVAFPFASIPKSFRDAKNTIKDLGLNYQKIHACPNDCIIYWGVNDSKEVCETCGLSRWKEMKTTGVGGKKAAEQSQSKIPAKVMRYFPLKPRLQRLFLSKEYSQLMRWHALERKSDGKLRHPADGEAWKRMDATYPNFSSEIRNVRLGLALTQLGLSCFPRYVTTGEKQRMGKSQHWLKCSWLLVNGKKDVNTSPKQK